jgi:hypothetical protein
MRCFRSGLVVVALSCTVAPPGLAQSGEARSMASMQQLSGKLARSYLQTWSSNTTAALDQVLRLYASRTRFYGQLLDHRRLMREKAGFLQRWPVRHYAHRPGTMRVTCDVGSARCLVRSVIDWRTESPARHAVSRGSSRFEQGIDLSGSRPLVFLESGSVLSHAGRVKRS